MWRLGVGRTFQVAASFGSMSVRENVQMVLLSQAKRLLDPWRAATQQHRGEALALLDQVGMRDQADHAASLLSYGDLKRLELAMALASAPRLLLMDEPAAGMGPKERDQLMALAARLAAQSAIGVLFTEHSMDVVFRYASRILVMARGRLIAQGDPTSVRDNPEVQAVYLGTGATFRAHAAMNQ